MTQSTSQVQLPNDADASGRSFGQPELEQLRRVIESGTLNCTRGRAVKELEQHFAKMLGVKHARAVTSGTAAVHCAVSAMGLEPGDEVITTPITDMGAITPILYQGGIPVFADVDPLTLNVTAETIERKITKRTRAIIVTHLFGDPCEMDAILALAARHKLPIIEDAAQSILATYNGRQTGTLGAIGCFSFQQGKHMTCGEGGMVVTNDDALARHVRLFSDKAWGYGDPKPDHYFMAPNYRMTELQGAVALAQAERLGPWIDHRIAMVDLLHKLVADVRGVHMPLRAAQRRNVYWRIALRVDDTVPGGAVAFGAQLRERGVACAPRYIVKPAFECEVLRDQRAFGKSGWPWVGEQRRNDPPVVYDRAQTPGVIQGLDHVVVLSINERYQPEHIRMVAQAIREAAGALVKA